MRIVLLIYTLLMLAGSGLTLGLVPRSLRDLGRERQRLAETMPEARFEQMVEAGYRLNTLLLLVEILYYYLLLRYGGPEWQFLTGGTAFGIIHIFYLVAGRWERARLRRGSVRTTGARLLIWATAVITVAEIVFLLWVAWLLLAPEDAARVAPGDLTVRTLRPA